MSSSKNVTSAVPSITRAKIVKYLTSKPIEKGKFRCYADVAALFKVKPEQVRRIYRTLTENGTIPNQLIAAKTINKPKPGQTDFTEDVKAGLGNVVAISEKRIKTLKELISVCEIDTEEWNIDRWLCNKWEVGAKDNNNIIQVTPLFQVKAWLSRRKIDTDLGKQKEALLNEIKTYSPKVAALPKRVFTGKEKLLEISLPDIHFWKACLA